MIDLTHARSRRGWTSAAGPRVHRRQGGLCDVSGAAGRYWPLGRRTRPATAASGQTHLARLATARPVRRGPVRPGRRPRLGPPDPAGSLDGRMIAQKVALAHGPGSTGWSRWTPPPEAAGIGWRTARTRQRMLMRISVEPCRLRGSPPRRGAADGDQPLESPSTSGYGRAARCARGESKFLARSGDMWCVRWSRSFPPWTGWIRWRCRLRRRWSWSASRTGRSGGVGTHGRGHFRRPAR